MRRSPIVTTEAKAGPDGKHWEGPPLEAWRAWTPQEAAERLGGFSRPWWVAGGWAIDLWLGEQTRPHGDLEIAILRPDFDLIRRRLAPLPMYSVGDGEVRRLADGATPPPDKHQNWVLDEAAGAWRMDIFLEPGDERTWVFRRQAEITAERVAVTGRTADGIPYLRPEAVLLFKAKARRPKDEADFAGCLPRLGDEARAWLARALRLAHPGHPWIEAL